MSVLQHHSAVKPDVPGSIGNINSCIWDHQCVPTWFNLMAERNAWFCLMFSRRSSSYADSPPYPLCVTQRYSTDILQKPLTSWLFKSHLRVENTVVYLAQTQVSSVHVAKKNYCLIKIIIGSINIVNESFSYLQMQAPHHYFQHLSPPSLRRFSSSEGYFHAFWFSNKKNMGTLTTIIIIIG